jgi:hypothetical protein
MKHFPARWPKGRLVPTVIVIILLLVIAAAGMSHEAVVSRVAAQTGAMETYAQASTGDSTPDTPSTYVTAARWEINPVTYSIGNCPRSLDCEAATGGAAGD